MKQLFSKANDNPIYYRFVNEKLEQNLLTNHRRTLQEVAVPLGQDLASRTPCQPEANCKVDNHTDPIYVKYLSDFRTAEVELQVNIQPDFIEAENKLANEEIDELTTQLEKHKNEHRIKSGDLERCDKGALKKDRRYNLGVRPLVGLIVLIDVVLSGSALESAGIIKGLAYGIGFVLGCGIFFLAEHFGEIVNKGRTPIQKRLIAFAIFSGLFALFMFLGKMRVLGYTNGALEGSEGIKPIYFAAINMFITFIAITTIHFTKLTRIERAAIDHFKITKKEVKVLDKKIKNLSANIKELKVLSTKQKLTREQITDYAQYIRNLIQGYFEESVRKFQSTNQKYRMDGKTPVFFKDKLKQLPEIKLNLKRRLAKVLTVLLIPLFCISCSSRVDEGTTISVLRDVTENHFLSEPEYESIAPTLGLEDNLWSQVTFRYGTLSSLQYSKRAEMSIKGEWSLLGNELERRKEVTAFLSQVSKVLGRPRDGAEHRYSLIWPPIVDEISKLQEFPSATLYIFSDISENSELFRAHSRTDQRLLEKSPDEIKERFLAEATHLVPGNGNVEVIVVYQPRNREEDLVFGKMKSLYEELFDELSIPVSFVANL